MDHDKGKKNDKIELRNSHYKAHGFETISEKKKKKGSKNEKTWKLLQTTDFKTLSNLNTMKTIPRK